MNYLALFLAFTFGFVTASLMNTYLRLKEIEKTLERLEEARK